jgi:hypothetical protein
MQSGSSQAQPQSQQPGNSADQELLSRVKLAVKNEREATEIVLQYLLEVDRRRLFLKLGYPSLFDFCVRELGYCAGSAHLRIQAMRLLREVPAHDRQEISQKISSGVLTLSQLSNIQTYSRQVVSHRVQPLQKLQILKKLEGQPTRESQKIILGELGLAGASAERMRVRGPDQVELTVTLDVETVELLEEWKALTSHANPEGRASDALRAALRVAVERARRERGVRREAEGATEIQVKSPENRILKEATSHPSGNPSGSPETQVPAVLTRAALRSPLHAYEVKNSAILPLPQDIPQSIRRLVWARDEGRCTYRDQHSGRRCEGRRYLEMDHILPRAQGGRHEFKNLRLLCGGHHRLRHE